MCWGQVGGLAGRAGMGQMSLSKWGIPIPNPAPVPWHQTRGGAGLGQGAGHLLPETLTVSPSPQGPRPVPHPGQEGAADSMRSSKPLPLSQSPRPYAGRGQADFSEGGPRAGAPPGA